MLASLIAVVVSLASVASAAAATTSTFSNSASIAIPETAPIPNEATTYPSTIAVSGMTGTISDLTVTLSGVKMPYTQDIQALLVSPTGKAMTVFSSVGSNTQSSTSNIDVTLSDSAGTSYGYNTALPLSGSVTTKPTDDYSTGGTANFPGLHADEFPSPAPSSFGEAAPTGTATLGGTFDASDPNGTWSLYVTADDQGYGGSIAGGWSLTITAGSTAQATTTTVGSAPNPSFTSGASSSVTLTATVTSGSSVNEGTVDFTDGGTTISGCGAEPVSNGTATCTTAISSEGSHQIQAQYSDPAGNFGSSSGTTTQEVDNHTVVNGSSYCNPGQITLGGDTAPADGTPFPSKLFVSGVGGTLSHISVTLNGVTTPYAQDVDALLVGPNGHDLVLVGWAGPNTGGALSNVTLTLDDAATSTLAQNAAWGSSGTSVTSKPVNYLEVDQVFDGAPTPYGEPAPAGSDTLGEEFNGSSPNGTWQLYVITTGGSADAGAQVARGWCANITGAGGTATSTALTSSVNPAFTAAPDHDVTFTATIQNQSSLNDGSVEFTDNGTAIGGCSAVTVSGGQATCTTSFATEGAHRIQAQFSGDATLAPSNATLSQEVDAHTTQTTTGTGASYCNPAGITLNDVTPTPPADGAPYPSHIFVSGLPGSLQNLTVTLNDVNYPVSQDLDALLVGPGGQSLLLVGDVGPNSGGALSHVTLTVEDSAASQLPQGLPWGGAGATVTTRPVDYGGLDETFNAPAPVPYGDPGPFGGASATLGSAFDATDPNGTWSLYTIMGAGGDGTGSIGSWCLGTMINSATPTVATRESTGQLPIGGSFSDVATVQGPSPDSGTEVSPTGTVTFDVFGPGDRTCTTPAFTQTVALSGLGTGPATAGSGNFTPTTAGTYQVIALYSGDGDYNSASSGTCGDGSGVVTVNPATPVLSSTPSGAITVGSGSISDSADLSGGYGAPGGTITFAAYGPNDPNCARTPAFTSAPVAVTGAGSYGSGDFTPTQAGTYQFVASYSGDDNNRSVSASCPDATETVAVNQATPSLSSTASGPTAVGSGSISDTATLTGGYGLGGTITFKAYGPNDPSCTNQPAFTSAAIAVTGAGSYGSGNFSPTQVGTYQFVASYSGDDNNRSVSGSCPDATDTVTVSQASPSLANHASAAVELGGTVSDTAILSAGATPSGQIVFRLYGPGDGGCSNPPAFTSAPVTVTGNGSYSSPRFTPTAVGSYQWVASYAGDANNGAAATACGAANSSVAVNVVTTATTLTFSPDPSAAGAPVTLTAKVTGHSPTGTVTFKDGSTVLGTRQLDATATATLTVPSISTGSHAFAADYAGDAANAASRGTAVDDVTPKANPQPPNPQPPTAPVSPPSVRIDSPRPQATFNYRQVVRARFSCSEGTGGPGISSCSGSVPTGTRLDTTKPGRHTFTVTATSGDGKRATTTVGYTVRPNNHFTVSRITTLAGGDVRIRVKLPGRGTVNVLETAWRNNLSAVGSSLLQPAPRRFVFARRHLTARHGGALVLEVSPTAAGRRLMAAHRYRPTIRLWISYTPHGGTRRARGFYALHFPRPRVSGLVPG